MARILLVWELGKGFGHIGNLMPFAECAIAAGHTVVFAMSDLSRAPRRLIEAGVCFIQSPYRPDPVTDYVDPINCYPELLFNIGWTDFEYLKVMCEAWQHIYEYVAPDVIVFDHSPTAMLAARGRNLRTGVVGTGFFIPPLRDPMPSFLRGIHCGTTENAVRTIANAVARQWNAPEMSNLAELFSQVDRTFLVTFPELDHYGIRPDVEYLGDCHVDGDFFPCWSKDTFPKVYAYLKPSHSSYQILNLLASREISTLAVGDGLPEEFIKTLAGTSVTLVNKAIDLGYAGSECDFAILNANHSTASSLLLAGRPLMLVPLHREQTLLARRIVMLDAGKLVNPNARNEIKTSFDAFLCGWEYYIAGAKLFAAKYDIEQIRKRRDETVKSFVGFVG